MWLDSNTNLIGKMFFTFNNKYCINILFLFFETVMAQIIPFLALDCPSRPFRNVLKNYSYFKGTSYYSSTHLCSCSNIDIIQLQPASYTRACTSHHGDIFCSLVQQYNIIEKLCSEAPPKCLHEYRWFTWSTIARLVHWIRHCIPQSDSDSLDESTDLIHGTQIIFVVL